MSGKFSDFEHEYTEKFRSLALMFGEFVYYHRDQSQRDFGLHLKKKFSHGSKTASSMVFFQLKGKLKSTATREELEIDQKTALKIEIEHLKQWYKYDTPTYLTVYLEALDEFYYLNIKKWVEDNYGHKILDEKAQTCSVTIPVTYENKLDNSAFEKMFIAGEKLGWKKVVGDMRLSGLNDSEHVELFETCLYMNSLIFRVNEIENKKMKSKVQMIDWISKTRGEVHFYDPSTKSKASEKYSLFQKKSKMEEFHSLWAYRFSISNLESTFSYLDFEVDEDSDNYGDEDIEFELKSGEFVYGQNAANEYFQYDLVATLNEQGKVLLKWILRMESAGLIEVSDSGDFVSIAPWHKKEI